MVVTRHRAVADYVRKARCFGLTPGTRSCEQFGAKLGMTEVQAAIGRVQLKRLEGRHEWREILWSRYRDVLRIVRPINCEPGVRDALHLYALFADREAVGAALKHAGIGYGIHYKPIYDEPEFEGTKPRYAENADRIGRRTISLPFFPEMTREDVRRVGKALEGVL
jgi:dTDP-4-amino-4,6-dideoxygalactose transaminase